MNLSLALPHRGFLGARRMFPFLAALAGFALGSTLGLPAVVAMLDWARAYLIPAFVELYASGIPFCG